MAAEKEECGEQVEGFASASGVPKAGFTVPTFPMFLTLASLENNFNFGALPSMDSFGSTWWQRKPKVSDLDIEPLPTTPPGPPTGGRHRNIAADEAPPTRVESEQAQPDQRIDGGRSLNWLASARIPELPLPSNAVAAPEWLWSARSATRQTETPPEESSQSDASSKRQAPAIHAPYGWYAGVLGAQVKPGKHALRSSSSEPREQSAVAVDDSGQTLPRAPDDEEYCQLDAAR
jgi:hypothetical protein